MASFQFGRFRLFSEGRRLTLDGVDIGIGERPLDVLIALVERHGKVVSRDELLGLVWQDARVVESALRFQINSVRTILDQGDERDLIASVAGRGYCFTGQVVHDTTEKGVEPSGRSAARLPQAAALIGRETDLRDIEKALSISRLVTVVGPGGIGKTSVAVSGAQHCLEAYRGRVDFVDFSALSDPDLVATAVASSLGLAVYGGDPLPGIAGYVGGSPRLMVWDNCEHVIDAAAVLAERLLGTVHNVKILATSREALHIDGEHVHRLAPLSFPEIDGHPEHYIDFDAVKLFIARSEVETIWTDGDNVLTAGKICRMLDGMPLAIEMAATHVAEFGVGKVSRLLDQSLSILTKGGNAIPQRHQTMRRALDWSYALLSEPETEALRGLSVFSGSFTRDAAFAVAGGGSNRQQFDASVSDLIHKSLISVDAGRQPVLHKLPQVTRAYALDKLGRGREGLEIRSRHQSFLFKMLREAEAALGTLEATKWRETYFWHINDVRTSLERSFQNSEHYSTAIALTAESSVLWLELGLMSEYRRYLDLSVTLMEHCALSPTVEMKITSLAGMVSHHTEGSTERTRATFLRSLELADELVSKNFQQRALTGMCAERLTAGDYPQGLVWAREFEKRFADINPGLCRRVVGHSLNYNGEFAESVEYAWPAYRLTKPNVVSLHNSGLQYDERTVLATILSRNLWVQGYPAQALEIVRDCVDHTLTVDHSITLSMSFATACVPVAIALGDFELASFANTALLDHVTRNSLLLWKPAAEFYALAIDAMTGNRPDDYELRAAHLASNFNGGPVSETAAMLGDSLVTESIRKRAEAFGGRWCRPEASRLRGEMLKNRGDHVGAQELFLDAARDASSLGAKALELRALISLARLPGGTPNNAVAIDRLERLFTTFNEGFGTTDLVTARKLLDVAR